jgi:hypothetical protein
MSLYEVANILSIINHIVTGHPLDFLLRDSCSTIIKQRQNGYSDARLFLQTVCVATDDTVIPTYGQVR